MRMLFALPCHLLFLSGISKLSVLVFDDLSLDVVRVVAILWCWPAVQSGESLPDS